MVHGNTSDDRKRYRSKCLLTLGEVHSMSAQSKFALVRDSLSTALMMTVWPLIIWCAEGAADAAAVTLNVVSARTEPAAGVTVGDPVTSYKYIINVDNTGTTTQRSPNVGAGCSPQDAGYTVPCFWTSIAGARSSSPIFTQGTGADFAAPLEVPNGRYLVSVLADGYKLDGQHFTVSDAGIVVDGVVVPNVTVRLQPTPLPDAQIQAAVFEDISPVNSAPDLPAEHGMAGFPRHTAPHPVKRPPPVFAA